MAVRKDILENVRLTETPTTKRYERDDIFNTPMGYTGREDYLKQFGISGDVGRNERVDTDNLLAELDRNQRRVEEQRYKSSVDFSGSVERASGKQIKSTGWDKVRRNLEYLVRGLESGTTTVLNSLNPLTIFDNLYLLTDSVVAATQNALAPYAGWETRKARTFTKGVIDTAKGFGAKDIDTQNIKNKTVRQWAEDTNKGKNIFEANAERILAYSEKRQSELSIDVVEPVRITGMVLNTVPQMATLFLPHGQVAFAASIISSNLSRVENDGTANIKDIEYALWNSNVEIASEMIFGLTESTTVLLKGALGRTATTAVKKGLSPTVGQIIWGMVKQGAEEGFEEAIAYPFQAFIEWSYYNKDKTFTDYWNEHDSWKEWGESALVGFIAGTGMSSFEARRQLKLSKAESNLLEQSMAILINTPAEDVDPKIVKIVADLYAKGVKSKYKNIEDYKASVKSEKQSVPNLAANETPATKAEPTVINDEFISNLKTTVAENKKAEAQAAKEKEDKAEKAKEKRSGKTFTSKPATILESKQTELVAPIVEKSKTALAQKTKQFDIIQQSNPATNDTQTWVRTADDIKTAKEVWGAEDYTGSTPDFTKADATNAIKKGKVTVYSSMPIENGVFVTPSKIEAQNYAGAETIYEKTVPLSDVAWIDDVQGQYAKLSIDKAPTVTEKVKTEKSKTKKSDTTVEKKPQIEVEKPPVVKKGRTKSVKISSKITKSNGDTTDTISYKDGNIEIMLNSAYAPNNEHSVVNFFVPEQSRKQGIGTRLINEIKTKYGGKGISSQVSNVNSLRLFYNNGFRPRENINATLQESLDMFKENESLNMTYNNDMSKQTTKTEEVITKSKGRTKTTTKFTQETPATASETVSTEKVDKVPVEKTKAVKKPVTKSKTIKRAKTEYKKGEWIKDKDGDIYRIQSKESDGYNVQMYNPESKKFVMDTFVEFNEIASGTKKQALAETTGKGKTKTTTQTKAQPVAKLPEVLQKIVNELPEGTIFNVHPITNKKDVKPMTLDEYSKLYESVLPEAKFRKGITEGKVIYNDVVYELITPVTEKKGQSALAKAMNVQAEKKISERESLGIVSKESKLLSDIVDKIAGNRDNVKNVTSDILPENIDYKNMTNAELNQRFKNIIGDEAYDTLEKNRKRVNDSGIWQKIKENANIKRNLLSGSVPIDLKYGDLRKLFRLYKNSKQASNQYASESVNTIYSTVPTEQIPLFMNMITMLDITDDIKLKRRGRSPINLTEQQIISALELINNAAKQNPVMFSNLLKAIDSRREIVREAVVEFVNESAKAGLDYSYLLLRENYMFHDVIEYDSKFFEGDMPAELKKIYKGKKKASGVAVKGRKGSVKDYLTDTFVLDWMSIARLKQMTVTVKILAEMQRYSIPESVTFDKNGTMFLPEGYMQVSAAALGIHNEQYYRNYIPERIRYRFEKIAKQKGLKKGTKKYRQALLRYNRTRFLRNFNPIAVKSGLRKGSKEYWRAYTEYRLMKVTGTLIVPEQFGDAIKTFMEYTPKKSYEVLTRKAMNLWKWTKIRAPHAVFKYNMRNMFGDLDAVFAGNIKALSKIGKSWSDLYNFYRNGKVNEGFEQYMLSGGLLTGVSAVTLGDVYKLPAMSDYYKQNKRGLISETKMRSLIKKALLETPTEFREQLLRYAAYLQWMEDIQKDGRVKNYGASHIVEIDSIREIHDKAFKLSNDLLGAYDDTSLLGQGIADHLIPFYRFTEINMKRYYRLLKNSYYTSKAVIDEGTSIAKRLGIWGRVGALTVFKLGKIGVQLSLYYGTLALINFLFAGDEEDELPQSVKDNPHLVLPLGWVGDGKIHYIDRLGSFAELMDMFAIDYGMAQDIRDIVTGRQELVDVLKESAGAFPMHFINSAFPAAKFMIEYVSGKSFYPNPSSPSNIRDKGEYLANQLGLKPLYKAIKGMPIPQGTYWKEQISVLSNSVLPGDAAMWDVYDMKDRFIRQYDMPYYRQENRNKDSLEYKRSMALYYYKLALKLQDKRAAEKYFNDYMMYGGTKNGMKTSISWLDPRRGFNASDLKKFKEWMTPEELETFNRAIDYYNEFIKNN